MKLEPILRALAALQAVKKAPTKDVTPALWDQCMRAHVSLETALASEGISFPVTLNSSTEETL